jgi:hypothetical protein
MTYAEKLKHPLWQKKRLEILQRDNFKCVFCQDDNTSLHVHHNYYNWDKEPWEYPNESLKTACKDCHLIIETLKEYLEYWDIESITRIKSNNNEGDFMFIAILIKPESINKIIFVYEYHAKIDSLTLLFETNNAIIERINDCLNG